MRVNTANRLFAMSLLAFDIMVQYESSIFYFISLSLTYILLREHFPVDKVPHKSLNSHSIREPWYDMALKIKKNQIITEFILNL